MMMMMMMMVVMYWNNNKEVEIYIYIISIISKIQTNKDSNAIN